MASLFWGTSGKLSSDFYKKIHSYNLFKVQNRAVKKNKSYGCTIFQYRAGIKVQNYKKGFLTPGRAET